MLMSATMSADVERLQKLVLHNPITLNLLASGGSGKANPAQGSAAEIEHFGVSTDRWCRHSVALTLTPQTSSTSYGPLHDIPGGTPGAATAEAAYACALCSVALILISIQAEHAASDCIPAKSEVRHHSI